MVRLRSVLVAPGGAVSVVGLLLFFWLRFLHIESRVIWLPGWVNRLAGFGWSGILDVAPELSGGSLEGVPGFGVPGSARRKKNQKNFQKQNFRNALSGRRERFGLQAVGSSSTRSRYYGQLTESWDARKK